MDSEVYDKDTKDLQFNAVSFKSYKGDIGNSDSEVISVKNIGFMEQITIECLVRIWKKIFKTYSTVKNDDQLQTGNILNYIMSELNYGKTCWGNSGPEKHINPCYDRLKSFIVHINKNDPEYERKNSVKQYTLRVIAIIFKYLALNQNSWGNIIKKTLRSVMHVCEDKVTHIRLSKSRSGLSEDSTPQVDIESLISQLPGHSALQDRRFSREKLNLSTRSLLKQVSTEKLLMSAPESKSIINSIYKDSPKYRYFVSDPNHSSPYLDSIVNSDNKSPVILDPIFLDKANSGNWDDNEIDKKPPRNRNNIEKRFRMTRNLRSMTKDFSINLTISEEPEKSKRQSSEEKDKTEEISPEKRSDVEYFDDTDAISNELQELAILNDIEKDSEFKIEFKKQSSKPKRVLGRKL